MTASTTNEVVHRLSATQMSKITPAYRSPSDEPRGLILPLSWQAGIGALFHLSAAIGLNWFYPGNRAASEQRVTFFGECLVMAFPLVLIATFFFLDDRWRWRAILVGAILPLLIGIFLMAAVSPSGLK